MKKILLGIGIIVAMYIAALLIFPPKGGIVSN